MDAAYVVINNLKVNISPLATPFITLMPLLVSLSASLGFLAFICFRLFIYLPSEACISGSLVQYCSLKVHLFSNLCHLVRQVYSRQCHDWRQTWENCQLFIERFIEQCFILPAYSVAEASWRSFHGQRAICLKTFCFKLHSMAFPWIFSPTVLGIIAVVLGKSGWHVVITSIRKRFRF